MRAATSSLLRSRPQPRLNNPEPHADVVVYLGPPHTDGMLRHVALVSPGGDVLLEHLSKEYLVNPATREDLTSEACAAHSVAPPLCQSWLVGMAATIPLGAAP